MTQAETEPSALPTEPARTAADRAFEAGDYRQALALARSAAEHAVEPAAREAAENVLRKLLPDAVQWSVLGLCALGLAVVIWFYA